MKADGEIRQSQILSTSGPGAMIDLPEQSVIISGLNHWNGKGTIIYEERLKNRVAEILGVNPSQLKLHQPPIDQEEDTNTKKSGIKAFVFPEWFVVQEEADYIDNNGKKYRSRRLIPRQQLDKKKKYDGYSVVPVRFVQACANGHISDIDWLKFAHKDESKCTKGGKKNNLILDESGSGNDFADIFIRCEVCHKRRPLSDATIPNAFSLGSCQGQRPWLGPNKIEDCIAPSTDKDKQENKPLPNRLLVRSASNAYFSQVVNVIAIPDSDTEFRTEVNQFYEEDLSEAEDIQDLERELKKKKFADLKKYSTEKIWEEIQRRKDKQPVEAKTIKHLEIETFLRSPAESGETTPNQDEDFYARTRQIDKLPPVLATRLEKIILVHRLREVLALVGFTRFEAGMPDVDGELDISVSRAALDEEISWVPAIENKGEGIFLSFSSDAIQKWLEKDAVKKREEKLSAGFDQWCKNKKIKNKPDFPGLPYVMLHSLSHLLITTVSLECGYAATAIRERIYANPKYGYGILLYTGTSGSEGTLGGLVEVGRNIESLIVKALSSGQLCSNDPVCSQHDPASAQEVRLLHGAVCHGCLLIAESSCERYNDFLDRALVINTLDENNAAFFDDDDFFLT